MVVENPTITADILNDDPQNINSWAYKWLVTFKSAKTESMLISNKMNKPDHPPLFMQNKQITEKTILTDNELDAVLTAPRRPYMR